MKFSPITFTFNGMLKTNEIAGEGNSYDFGARMHDGRLGRWLSLDPLKALYPSMSPFNFGGNNPIYFVDTDGEKITPHGKEELIKLYLKKLKKETNLKVKYNLISKTIEITGDPKNELDKFLLRASQSDEINVNLYLYDTRSFKTKDGTLAIGETGGSYCGAIKSEDGCIETEQWINPNTFEYIRNINKLKGSKPYSHEIIESFNGGELTNKYGSILTSEAEIFWFEVHPKTENEAKSKGTFDMSIHNNILFHNIRVPDYPNPQFDELGFQIPMTYHEESIPYLPPEGITSFSNIEAQDAKRYLKEAYTRIRLIKFGLMKGDTKNSEIKNNESQHNESDEPMLDKRGNDYSDK